MAVSDAHVFLGFLTPIRTQLSFQSHRLLFSHVSAEKRCENTPERKFATTGSRTHNHQAMGPTCSSLSHPARAAKLHLKQGLLYDKKYPKKVIYTFLNVEQCLLQSKLKCATSIAMERILDAHT